MSIENLDAWRRVVGFVTLWRRVVGSPVSSSRPVSMTLGFCALLYRGHPPAESLCLEEKTKTTRPQPTMTSTPEWRAIRTRLRERYIELSGVRKLGETLFDRSNKAGFRMVCDDLEVDGQLYAPNLCKATQSKLTVTVTGRHRQLALKLLPTENVSTDSDVAKVTYDENVVSTLTTLVEVVPRYRELKAFMMDRAARKLQRAWRKRRAQIDTPLAVRLRAMKAAPARVGVTRD